MALHNRRPRYYYGYRVPPPPSDRLCPLAEPAPRLCVPELRPAVAGPGCELR